MLKNVLDLRSPSIRQVLVICFTGKFPGLFGPSVDIGPPWSVDLRGPAWRGLVVIFFLDKFILATKARPT